MCESVRGCILKNSASIIIKEICCKKCPYLYKNRPVATRWLQTVCVIKFFICKRKLSIFLLTAKVSNTKCYEG